MRMLTDKDMRARVHLCGALLGDVLRSQAGEQVYEAVETLRRGFVQLAKKDQPKLRARLTQLIRKLTPDQMTHVIRAFAAYFSLLNVSEEEFQHRKRRDFLRQGMEPWVGSITETIREFHAAGMSAPELQKLFGKLAFIPVITAHPTEAKRRTIKEALRRIFITLEGLDDPRLSKEEIETQQDTLRYQIQLLWKTDEIAIHAPSVLDEIRNGLYYFRESLFDAVPVFYRSLEKAIARHYPYPAHPRIEVPSFLRFGSWIGGDRDGNPNVTPEITRTAACLHMRVALQKYIASVVRLSHILAHSQQLCRPSDAFLEAIQNDETEMATVFANMPKRFAYEPYRRKLFLMQYRLERNLEFIENLLNSRPAERDLVAYSSETEFLDDLLLIRDSLIHHGDEVIAERELKDLIRQVETFGFFLMRLDVRQESGRHTEAAAEILARYFGCADYPGLDEAQRQKALTDAINATPPAADRNVLSNVTRETLAVFDAITAMKAETSEQIFDQYVISMTHEASHVLEVLLLARMAGLFGKTRDGWQMDFRVSPLFETIDDLNRIEGVVATLLDNPTYAALLKASGNIQEIMLGYSDSCKDGGILASNWKLYEAQKRITAFMESRGVQCRLFHGRGGSIARGGGPTHEAIVAQPTGTVAGQIKFTEQGEVLSYKYSNAETAAYELTIGASGLLKAARWTVAPTPQDRPDYLRIMAEIAGIGEAHYRELTENTAGFMDYFYEATPVQEIGLLNIGSRPARRVAQDRSRASIRAIPWVFGWGQSRQTIPAWYGIGTALRTWRGDSAERLEQLRRMYREWPFFRALLSNSQMSLFKSDLRIAQEYASLCRDPATGQRVYACIHAEFETAVVEVLQVAQIDRLMAETPDLMLQLSRRDPYLMPLNYIQADLLRQHRGCAAADGRSSPYLDPLLRSINALAAGLRNTG